MSVEPPKQTKDYSEEVDSLLPKALSRVDSDPTQLTATLEELLSLEKRTRLAADAKNTVRVCVAMLDLCVSARNWTGLTDYISILSKRRAQLQKAQEAIVQHGVELVAKTPDLATKKALIESLRTVSDGKMFVELERARLTMDLAVLYEKHENNVNKAAEVLQEVQVETIGSMEAREKCEFLLHQIRLCLAKRDYVRAEIIAKKVDTKQFAAGAQPDLSDLKVKFYQLMIHYHMHAAHYFEIAKAYREILNTKSVEADAAMYKQTLTRLIIFGILSEFDSEVSDLLHRIKLDKRLNSIPAYKQLLDQFTGEEIIQWPIKYEKDIKQEAVFSQDQEGDETAPVASDQMTDEDAAASGARNILVHNKETRWADFHKRIIQHNLRIVALYYSAIRMSRLAELLSLTEGQAEIYLSELVSSKQLFAKIDRPQGEVVFRASQSGEQQLNEWSGDITQLLQLIETTTHQINKENMIYKIK